MPEDGARSRFIFDLPDPDSGEGGEVLYVIMVQENLVFHTKFPPPPYLRQKSEVQKGGGGA